MTSATDAFNSPFVVTRMGAVKTEDELNNLIKYRLTQIRQDDYSNFCVCDVNTSEYWDIEEPYRSIVVSQSIAMPCSGGLCPPLTREQERQILIAQLAGARAQHKNKLQKLADDGDEEAKDMLQRLTSAKHTEAVPDCGGSCPT